MKVRFAVIRWLLLALPYLVGTTHSIAQADDPQITAQLLSASGYGDVAKIAQLLQQGADVNATSEYGHSPLYLASRSGHLKAMRFLIAQGADVNAKTQSDDSVLKAASGGRGGEEAVKILLDAGAEPDPAALSMACWLGHREIAELLLKSGVSPQQALTGAAAGGHVEIVQLLLDQGADVIGITDAGSAALHGAALQGGLPTVQLLIEKGADPNATDAHGETPLHKAISGDGNLEIVMELVQAGAKLNIANKEGITPVRLAGQHRSWEVHGWLLTTTGGVEPLPDRHDQDRDPAARPTEELLRDLSATNRETRNAAQRALVLRGKEIMPEVMRRIETETNTETFYELFRAMGPAAEAALPLLESQLASKEHVFIASITIEQLKPGGLAGLSTELKKEAADALYEAIVDPQTDVAVGVHVRLLIFLGEPTVPTILKLLRHERPGIREFIARQLEGTHFQSEELVAELLKLQADDDRPEVRASAARALANPRFRSSVAKAALIEQLRTPPIRLESLPANSGEEREAAYREKVAIDKLLDSAAQSLAAYGPSIVNELLPIIRNQADPASEQCERVWGFLGEEAVPEFKALLDDRDDMIRRIAYEQIGRLAASSDEALAEIAARLESAEADHRQIAIEAIWDIRGPSSRQLRPRLLELLHDDRIPARTRLLAVSVALRADAGATQASEALRQFLPTALNVAMEGEHHDRCLALEALGEMGPAARDAIPQLQALTQLPLPRLPDGPRPRVGEDLNAEWRSAMTERSRAQIVRRCCLEALKKIEAADEQLVR